MNVTYNSLIFLVLSATLALPIAANAARPSLSGIQEQIDSLEAGPDPACYDDTNRYVECGDTMLGNGTFTDTVTGLVWLQTWFCDDVGLLADSLADAAEKVAQLQDGVCNLRDNSKPGDWRLPTKEDWEKTIKRALELGCTSPPLTNRAGTGCYESGNPFAGPVNRFFATSSSDEIVPSKVWTIQLGSMDFFILDDKDGISASHAWAVRNGESGPKGDKGDPGVDGIDGVDGADGAAGADGVANLLVIDKVFSPSPPGQDEEIELETDACPNVDNDNRRYVTGGGGFIRAVGCNSHIDTWALRASYPSDCDNKGCKKWKVVARSDFTVTGTGCTSYEIEVTAYAICASIK